VKTRRRAAGQAIFPAVVSDTAVNEALQHIGVQEGQAADKLVAAGLGLHRNTDDWLE
jgi:hypothetical protein